MKSSQADNAQTGCEVEFYLEIDQQKLQNNEFD